AAAPPHPPHAAHEAPPSPRWGEGDVRAALSRMDIAGAAEIAFVERQGRTRLRHLYQRDPLGVLFPDDGPVEPPVAVVLRASRECMATGLVHDGWELRRDGRLIWADAFHLADDSLGSLLSKMADPACLDGATACATLLLAAPDVARFLAGARETIAASGVRG